MTGGGRRVLTFALLAATGALAACSKDKGPPPKPTIPVVVATAGTGDIPVTLPSNGTVEPLATVAIQPQATGTLLAVHFAEGDEVEKGQLLFEIDPAPARASLAQARAVLARDRATATAAGRDADRYASLVKQGYVTQSQADQQRATAAALASTIAADQASVQTAELNLGYAMIRAPISGKTGNLNVRAGNLVRVPSPVPLVTINAVTPIRVRFPVPDRALDAVRAAQRSGHPLTVLVNGTATGGTTERGTVDFIDNAVDSVTGSVMLKAKFTNADRRLWPGAFVPVTLTTGITRGAIIVPAAAVQQGPQGAYVFVGDSAKKARQLPVVVDRTVNDVAIIAKGVRAGQQVVVDGQSRLSPGAKMKVARVVATQMPTAPDSTARAAGGTPGAPANGPAGGPVGAIPTANDPTGGSNAASPGSGTGVGGTNGGTGGTNGNANGGTGNGTTGGGRSAAAAGSQE